MMFLKIITWPSASSFNVFLKQELRKIQARKNENDCDLDKRTLIGCISKFDKIYKRFNI